MILGKAIVLAERLREILEPAAERIAIAGSIRRRKREVKDIELVAIPRWREEPIEDVARDMFAAEAPMRSVNLLREALERLERDGKVLQVIKPGTHEIIPWQLKDEGRYWRLYLAPPGIKVDLFLCSPETWGLNYMIRTGSGVGPSGIPSDGFAPRMLSRWKEVAGPGAHAAEARLWRPAHREPEETREERQVFDLCRVRYVPPIERISAADVDRYAL